jgi:2-dehydro-3-deoxygalactonokinase
MEALIDILWQVIMELFSTIVDMGTTNTRLNLVDSLGNVHGSVKGEFGVKDRAASGSRGVLIQGLHALVEKVTEKTSISPAQIMQMLCSGMITSEIGLVDIPHLFAPVNIKQLSANIRELSMPEILPAPIICIPGIRNRIEEPSQDNLGKMDFMRGEETQVFGAIDLYEIPTPVTFMFLSSHTKLVDVDEDQRITGSFTTLSGQIFNAFRFDTLLASSVPKKDPEFLHEEALARGIKAGIKTGILRAGMIVRFMDVLIDTSPEERFAFLEGLIIASDIYAIKSSYPFLREHMVILGNPLRTKAYELAFKQFFNSSIECRYLGEESMDRSAIRGALKIAELGGEGKNNLKLSNKR